MIQFLLHMQLHFLKLSPCVIIHKHDAGGLVGRRGMMGVSDIETSLLISLAKVWLTHHSQTRGSLAKKKDNVFA